MNLKTKLAASLLLAASASVAQASIYNVAASFYEPMTNGNNTFFNGTFDWNGTTVSNLMGTMNSSMYPVNNVNPDYKTSFPLMNLNYQLGGTTISGNTVTASVFLKNTTDVYYGGGYDGVASGFMKYGASSKFMPAIPGQVANENAFFTLAFDMTNMTGALSKMVYGDCTAGGLMMGNACMAGEITGGSMMAATPLSLTITPAAVPLPAAAWLFGSALMGLLGFNRRKRILPV